MSDALEIKGLSEAINEALVPLRQDVDTLKDRDLSDVVTQEKHDKMVEQITDSMQKMQDAQAKMAARLDRPGAGDGDDAEKAERKAAFLKFLRKGIIGEHRADNEPIEIKAMSTDVKPDGGYLVYPEISDMIVSRVFETSPIRQVANVMQTESTTVEMLIDDDESDANWAGEGAAGSETDTAQLGRKTIAVHKLEALPKMTVEMTQSAYLDVEAWHAQKVADRFSRRENAAFVSGSGVNQPYGFLTYPAWASAGTYQRGRIEDINTGAAAAITADGLIELQASLKEPYQPGAVFMMHRTTFGSALKLKGNDTYFFSPTMLRDGQPTLTLLGKPVFFAGDMPLEGAGALCAVYGDFSRGYTIVDGVGLTVLRDPFTSKGFVTFYTTKRVGGDVTNFDAIKRHKCST